LKINQLLSILQLGIIINLRLNVWHYGCGHMGVLLHHGCDPIGVAVHIRIDTDSGALPAAVADDSELHGTHFVHVAHSLEERTAGVSVARIGSKASGANLVLLH